MAYLGSWKIDDLVTFSCNTHTPSTGAAVDADAVPGYRIYEDETGTPILTGSMALLDDGNTVGFYSEQITLSAANGFEKGKSYQVRITGVVGGVTGVLIHTLQVEAEVDANTVSATNVSANIAQISGDGTAADNAEAFFDGTGYAGTNNVIPTVTSVTNGVSIADTTSDAVLADALWNAATSGYGTAGTYGELIESGNVGGGAIIAASVTGAVGSVTGAVGSVTGAVGSVTGAVGSVTGSVGSIATGGIAAASFAAGAIDAAAIATGAIDADAIATGAIDADAIADNAIDAGAIADNAIDSGALATTAITEIQSGLATATNVSDAQTAITALLPAALVSGRIDASVGAVANGAITAAAIATGAIDADAIADDAIDAGAIAANAIDASALATDAITEITTGVLTTAMTEAYAADGAAPTLAQALFEIMQFHNERNISGATITVKKRDGSTTAYTLTYDATSITRAT